MTIQEMIVKRAESRVAESAQYSHIQYGRAAKRALVEHEATRIATALIDIVCPEIQPPVELSDQPCSKCGAPATRSEKMSGGTTDTCTRCGCIRENPCI